MKTYAKPLLTGAITALILILVMWKITMNFQVLLFLGTALFFVAGYLNTGRGNHLLLAATAILIFYCTFFIWVVLEQLPQLWYFVPIYAAAALLGLLYQKNKRRAGVAIAVLAAGMLLMAVRVIPRQLDNMLTKERYDALPEFTIRDMDGGETDSRSLKGKVVVLDFFGTWCKPCILELRELDDIQAAFDESQVVFYVINADQGGDTPEKFQTFIDRNDYTFRFAYDHDSEIFRKLKMNHLGLPTLLIIDKDQQIRLQHVGYNPAETHFRDRIMETIQGLQ